MFKFSAVSQIWKKYIRTLNAWDLSLISCYHSSCLKYIVYEYNLLYSHSNIYRYSIVWMTVHPDPNKCSIRISINVTESRTLLMIFWRTPGWVAYLRHHWTSCLENRRSCGQYGYFAENIPSAIIYILLHIEYANTWRLG